MALSLDLSPSSDTHLQRMSFRFQRSPSVKSNRLNSCGRAHRKSLSINIAVGLLFTFLACASGYAQTGPTPTTDDQMGLTPYQTYHGGDIDNVSLSTGGLIIHAPLLSYPQRGGLLKENFSLLYNSKPYSIRYRCTPPDGCVLYWYGAGAAASANVVDDQSENFLVSKIQVPQPPSAYKCFFSIVDSDLAKHPMGQTVGSNICTTNSNGTAFETIDATGSHMAVDSTGNFTIIDSAGIRYHLGTGTPPLPTIWKEDPNGNEITRYTGGIADTLGRQIPSVPNSATGGSDSSSCPQGGTLLPIVSASVWTPPGYNGGNLPN